MSQPLSYPPAPRPSGTGGSVAKKGRTAVRSGFMFASGYVILIWAVHVVNVLVFGGNLVFFGVHPLDTSAIWHIITAPLLHANFEHLI